MIRPTPLQVRDIVYGGLIAGLAVLYFELRLKVDFASADHVAELECRVAALQSRAINKLDGIDDGGCEAERERMRGAVREVRVE
jgi:hypothetical protein